MEPEDTRHPRGSQPSWNGDAAAHRPFKSFGGTARKRARHSSTWRGSIPASKGIDSNDIPLASPRSAISDSSSTPPLTQHVRFPAVRAQFSHCVMALGGVPPRFILGHGAQKPAVDGPDSWGLACTKGGEKQAVWFEPVGAILYRLLEPGGVAFEKAQHVFTYHDVGHSRQFHVAHVSVYELVDFGVKFSRVYAYRAGPSIPCLRRWRCTS